MSPERTVRQFVDEVNRLIGEEFLTIRYGFLEREGAIYSKHGAWQSFWPGNEERLMAPAEQEVFLCEFGLEGYVELMGLDAQEDSD